MLQHHQHTLETDSRLTVLCYVARVCVTNLSRFLTAAVIRRIGIPIVMGVFLRGGDRVEVCRRSVAMRRNETNVTLDTTDIDIRQNSQSVATT